MKKKTLLAIAALVVVSAFLFVACSQPATSTPSESPSQSQADESATPAPTPTPDTPATPAPQPSESAEVPAEAAPVTVMTQGTITEFLENDDQMYVVADEPVENSAVNDVIANMDNALVIDAQTGWEVDSDALRVGDEVIVYLSGAMTFSLPPIANAYAVITNLPDDATVTIPTFLISKEVTQNDDGSVTVLNENGDLYVTFTSDIPFETFGENGQAAAISDIKVDRKLFAWFDVVAESYPAQAGAQQAVIDIDD